MVFTQVQYTNIQVYMQKILTVTYSKQIFQITIIHHWLYSTYKHKVYSVFMIQSRCPTLHP